MALLNPPEFMPEVVRMLTEAVADGVDDREELVAMAAPGSVGGDRSGVVRDSLSAAMTLGLVTENKGRLQVSEGVHRAIGSDGSLRGGWGNTLLDHLLAAPTAGDAMSENMKEGGEAHKGVRDLVYSATWFLSQDAQQSYTWGVSADGDHQNAQFLHLDQAGEGKGALSNDTRWQSLKRWLIPLGLAQFMPVGPGIQPVPGVQVERILREESEERSGEAVPVNDLCALIGRRIPFLWLGSARAELATALGADPDPDVQSGGVDSSIGQALEQLEHTRVVVLENRSDAGQRSLIRASGDAPRPVTHVVLTDGGVA